MSKLTKVRTDNGTSPQLPIWQKRLHNQKNTNKNLPGDFAHLLGSRGRQTDHRRGTQGTTDAAQLELALNLDHHQAELVQVVQRHLAHRAVGNHHLGAGSRNTLDNL